MRNIDWSMYLRMRNNRVLRTVGPLVLDRGRRRRFAELPENLLVHDLSKGLPFESGTADVVYHSHLLEHLDREGAAGFLAEVHRVLAPGGIHRVVVPDLELLCREYLEDLDEPVEEGLSEEAHEERIEALIEQMVRRQAFSSRGQSSIRRTVERALLGDARRRGETHRWMYDRVNLAASLRGSGLVDVERRSFDSSSVPDWRGYRLDLDDGGGEYKAGSLYMEGRKNG